MLYIDSQMIKRSTWGNKKRKALKRNENKIRLELPLNQYDFRATNPRFAHYRDIDDDMIKEMITLLD